MTGVICDDMRKNSGLVFEGHADQQRKIDDSDAIKIELGMRRIPFQQRLLLDWCYIEQARPEVVCRKVSIPIAEFVDRFRDAQEAIEDIVDGGNR